MRIEDLPPSLAALVGDDLDCIADDGEIDDGMVWHIRQYAFEDLGIVDPESQEWVAAAVQANPGIWTARLCRRMHDREETNEDIAHCGLCREYANIGKRQRARSLPPTTLPGYESIGGAYQLYPRCGKRGLTWLRKLVYRRRDQGRWETRREVIPDPRTARGWDWATRIYAR